MRYFVAQTFCVERGWCEEGGWSGFSIDDDGTVKEVVRNQMDAYEAKCQVRDLIRKETGFEP